MMIPLIAMSRVNPVVDYDEHSIVCNSNQKSNVWILMIWPHPTWSSKISPTTESMNILGSWTLLYAYLANIDQLLKSVLSLFIADQLINRKL